MFPVAAIWSHSQEALQCTLFVVALMPLMSHNYAIKAGFRNDGGEATGAKDIFSLLPLLRIHKQGYSCYWKTWIHELTIILSWPHHTLPNKSYINGKPIHWVTKSLKSPKMSPGHESKLRKWMAVNGKTAPMAGFHETEIFSQANELAIPGYPGLAPEAFPSSSPACCRSIYLPRQHSQSTAENGLNLRYNFRASAARF